MNIHIIMQSIRDAIHKHGINQNSLYQLKFSNDRMNWNKLCSSMNMVEDTQLAIDGYEQLHKPISRELGYLSIFGLMQAMYVQQNAVKHMYESFGFGYTRDQLLCNIRDVRNKFLGHPTHTHRDNTHSSQGICRPTLTLDSFMVSIHKATGENEWIEVNTETLISDQYQAINKELNQFITLLESRYQ